MGGRRTHGHKDKDKQQLNEDEARTIIGNEVKNYNVDQLEGMNNKKKQAGVKAYRHEDFIATEHVSKTILWNLNILREGESDD